MTGIAVAGIGLALAGVEEPADLTGYRPQGTQPLVDPGARIGKRGLRYKDRATQLALCAAADALTDAGLLAGDVLAVDGGTVAVVVSSNLGNLDTVCRVAGTIAGEGVAGTSPMDLPNASSNVIASSVAIRFGLRGPNVMVCNGPTSGLDAAYWGATLIRAGRAERALVIGVETANQVVARLTDSRTDDLLDGAAALVLQSDGGVAKFGRYARAADLAGCVDAVSEHTAGTYQPAGWYVPAGFRGQAPRSWLDALPRVDLTERFGAGSGALGVLQCAAAAAEVSWRGAPVLVTNGAGTDDACAGVVMLP